MQSVNLSKPPIISVVDDDESVRQATKSLLKALGLRAEAFSSAEEFLDSLYLWETDCLILDVRMPGMGGLELQRQLAAASVQIPIIFTTAHGDQDVRAQALAAGAVAFLNKPFSEEALLNAIEIAL